MLNRLFALMTICCLLSVYTIPVLSYAAKTEDTCSPAPITLEEGDYADGRVIVSLISPSENMLTKKGITSFDKDIRIEQSACIGAADDLYGTSKNSITNKFLQDKTVYITEAVSDTYSTEELIQKLENKAYVAEVAPDYKQYLSSEDPYEKEQWYLDGKGSYQSGGTGISFSKKTTISSNEEPVIAIMDTGINASHEDLIDHLWINPTDTLKGTYGYDFATDSADCTDTSGHGTHCAGIIAATADNQKGICGISNAKIMTLKIFDDKEECYNSYIINALTYLQQAKKAGIPIVAVNCSWGGGSSSTAMKTLIRALGQEGMLFVFAAGNDCKDQDNASAECPYDLFNTSSYSDLRNYILTVGASDCDEEAASFSDYGKTSVDLFAPGENIVSTYICDNFYPDLYHSITEKESKLTSFYQPFDNIASLQTLYTDSDVGYKTSTTSEIQYDSHDFYNQTDGGCLRWDIHMGFPSFRRKQSFVYVDVTDYDLDPEREYYISMMFATSNSTSDSLHWQHVTKHSSGSLDSDSNRFYKSSNGQLYLRIIGLDAANTAIGTTTIYLDNIGISTADPDTTQFDQYELLSGTSMAAPMVTGALALCAAYIPTEDAYNRKCRLLTCVRPVESLSAKCVTGGILDISKIDVYKTKETPDLTPAEVPEIIDIRPKDTLPDSSATENTEQTAIETTVSHSDTSTMKGAQEADIKIKNIKFTKKIKNLRAGRKYKLRINYTPSDSSNKKIKWTTSKKIWASVSNTGVVKAKKKGIGHTVRITATTKDGSRKKASLRIKIKK